MERRAVCLAALLPFVWFGVRGDPVPDEREPIHMRVEAERDAGYAQAYRVGKTIYVSGISGKGDNIEEQLESAYERMGTLLAQVGAEPFHVVKETVHTTNMDAFLGANEVRKTFYTDHLPAATFVGVDRLARRSYLIEVEAVAVLP